MEIENDQRGIQPHYGNRFEYRNLEEGKAQPSEEKPLASPKSQRHFHSAFEILSRLPLGLSSEQFNRVSLLSTLLAVSLDPVFFYVIVVNEDDKCLFLDMKLGITAAVLRSVVDFFYIIYIASRLRHDFVPPLSSYRRKRKYFLSWSLLIDMLAILPVPQVVLLLIVPTTKGSKFMEAVELLKCVVIFQYIPRILRVYLLFKQDERTSGSLFEDAWARTALNIFFYLLAGHVLGALWYFLSIERQATCWRKACEVSPGCLDGSFYCDGNLGNYTFLNDFCPISPPDQKVFDFGIYTYALQSGIEKTTSFPEKFFHCFRWGLQNLSSFGQNLQTTPFIWENCFVVFVLLSGLGLFVLLIGNVQIYWQSRTMKLEEMRFTTRVIKEWKPFKRLSPEVQLKVMKYQRYLWQQTRGIDVDNVLKVFPKALTTEIKSELCRDLLQNVALFRSMGKKLVNALCFCAKPVLFVEGNHLIKEEDMVNEMIFIVQGELQICDHSGKIIGRLKGGSFCGDELLKWVEDPKPEHLPLSTKTIQASTNVEAFAVSAYDLKRNWDALRRYAVKLVESRIHNRKSKADKNLSVSGSI